MENFVAGILVNSEVARHARAAKGGCSDIKGLSDSVQPRVVRGRICDWGETS